MTEKCEIVRDLLPLYADAVCSPGSRELVEKHLADCGDCRNYLERLKDEEAGMALEQEQKSVVARQQKKFKRKSFTVGLVFAGIFAIPVLVCLIVNLAVGAGLSWFFIVLTALMLAASLIVVPLMVPRRRFLYALGASTGSLLLLLLSCALYGGGNWFFVAASACVFGICVLFLPLAVYQEPLCEMLGKHKGLAVMAADTLLFALMMFCIGRFNGLPGFWSSAMLLSGYPLLFAWVLFAVIRYLPVRKSIRGGICCILSGGFLFTIENVENYLLGYDTVRTSFCPFVWNAHTVEGNVMWSVLLFGTVLGLVLIVCGCIGKKGNR